MAFEDLMEKAATHHMNPAMGRAHSRMRDRMAGKPEHEERGETGGHGPVVETSVVRHDDGKAHVRARHKDGHEKIHDHEDENSAHDHARSLMAGGGGGEEHDIPHQPTAGEPTEGSVSEESEACPECGAEMQDGKCPQCGYQDGDEGGEAED